jgi:hypothetical protein
MRVFIGGRTRRVHILVAEAFIANPFGLPQVNHQDGDKAHNHYLNLEWATNSDNQKHRYRVLGHKPAQLGKTGIKCKNSKPVWCFAISTGAFIRAFGSAAEAAREMNIDGSGISMAARGELRSYKGYRWAFISREQYAEIVA